MTNTCMKKHSTRLVQKRKKLKLNQLPFPALKPRKRILIIKMIIPGTDNSHQGMDGPVVKNPPSNAGDAGSNPGRGTQIPHAMGQLSPRAANYRAHTLWSSHTTTREEKIHTSQLERSLCASTKSSRATTKTRRSQINK